MVSVWLDLRGEARVLSQNERNVKMELRYQIKDREDMRVIREVCAKDYGQAVGIAISLGFDFKYYFVCIVENR